MHDLTSTTGIVALAAGGVAAVALLFAIVLAFRLRRVRKDQKAVLGANGSQPDLAAHALQIEQGFTDLRDLVDETMSSPQTTPTPVHRRLHRPDTRRGLGAHHTFHETPRHQARA